MYLIVSLDILKDVQYVNILTCKCIYTTVTTN